MIKLSDYATVGTDVTEGYTKAIELSISGNVPLFAGPGVWYLTPRAYWIPGHLHVIGAGMRSTTIARASANEQSWTQRLRGHEGCSVTFENLTLDGNNDDNVEPIGDQNHEIRFDGDGDEFRLENVGFRDLIDDGVQFVSNTLKLVTADGCRWLGGDKGRRVLQFSYHPDRAIISDSTFHDFSTEPAGGAEKLKMDLQVNNCQILGRTNIGRVATLQMANVISNGLSSLTGDDCQIANCTFDNIGSPNFYGPCTSVISQCLFRMNTSEDGKWVQQLKLWPRFEDHIQDVIFRDCRFEAMETHSQPWTSPTKVETSKGAAPGSCRLLHRNTQMRDFGAKWKTLVDSDFEHNQ